MQITGGLGVYWLTPKRAQIGLDPRTGVQLAGLNPAELALVDALTLPHTPAEFANRAEQLHVSERRVAQILDLLSRAGVLDPHPRRSAEESAWWRLRQTLPQREEFRVEITQADHLGTQLALGLAQAGIGTISTPDADYVGSHDHPLLVDAGFGQLRRDALTTLMRAVNPKMALSQSEPKIAVVTGSHAIDTFTAMNYLARGIPVFPAWTEEVDVYVGPLFLPHASPCPACLYHYRKASVPNWDVLSLQAVSGRIVVPESSGRGLASALAVRTLLAFIDGQGHSVADIAWRIPPAPDLPESFVLPPHPDCTCGAALQAA